MTAADGGTKAPDVVRALEEVERLIVEPCADGDGETMARELAVIRDTLRRLRKTVRRRLPEDAP